MNANLSTSRSTLREKRRVTIYTTDQWETQGDGLIPAGATMRVYPIFSTEPALLLRSPMPLSIVPMA